MSTDGDSPSTLLGGELSGALDRSLETSLRSLTSLRRAVRAYVIHHRDSGMTLSDLCNAAEKVLFDIEDKKANGSSSAFLRDPELARQLREWCRQDFSDRY